MSQVKSESRWAEWFGNPRQNAAVPVAASVGVSTTGSATQGMQNFLAAEHAPSWLIPMMATNTAVTYYLMNTFLYGTSVTQKAKPTAPTLEKSDPILPDHVIFEARLLGRADDSSQFLENRKDLLELKAYYDRLCNKLRTKGFTVEDCYYLRLDMEVERLRKGSTDFIKHLKDYVVAFNHKFVKAHWDDRVKKARANASANLHAIRKKAKKSATLEIERLALHLSFDERDRFIQNRLTEINELIQPLKGSDWKELRELQIPAAMVNDFIAQRESVRERKKIYDALFTRLEETLHEHYKGWAPKRFKNFRKGIYDGLRALLFAMEYARVHEGDPLTQQFALKAVIEEITGQGIADDALSVDAIIARLNKIKIKKLNALIQNALLKKKNHLKAISAKVPSNAQADATRFTIPDAHHARFVEYRIREQEKISRNTVPGFKERLARSLAKVIGGTGAVANGAMTYGGLGKVLGNFMSPIGVSQLGITALLYYFVVAAIISSLSLTYQKTVEAIGKLGRLFDSNTVRLGTKERKRIPSLILSAVLTIGVGIVSGAIAYAGTQALLPAAMLGWVPVIGWTFAIATFVGASSLYSQNFWKRLGQFKSKIRIAFQEAKAAKEQNHSPIKAFCKSIFNLAGNGPWQKAAKVTAGILGLTMVAISTVMAMTTLIGLLGASGILPGLCIAAATSCVTIMLGAIYAPNLYELFSRAGSWLDKHRLGPGEAIGMALDKTIKAVLPFVISLAVVSLAVPATWPVWAASAVLIGTGLIVSTLILPPLRKAMDKLGVNMNVNICFRSIGRGIDKLFGKLGRGAKQAKQAEAKPHSGVREPLIAPRSQVKTDEKYAYSKIFSPPQPRPKARAVHFGVSRSARF